MSYVSIADKVLLPEKRDVLRIQLYFKLIQYGIRPFENDMDIILELYSFGGYNNSEEQSLFIKSCMDKKYKKSEQSVRNTLSKYTTNGVFDKPRNTSLSVNEKYLPKVDCTKLMLKHIISHAD